MTGLTRRSTQHFCHRAPVLVALGEWRTCDGLRRSARVRFHHGGAHQHLWRFADVRAHAVVCTVLEHGAAVDLTALEDQQLGGLIMSDPAGTLLLAAFLILLVKWIESSRQERWQYTRIAQLSGYRLENCEMRSLLIAAAVSALLAAGWTPEREAGEGRRGVDQRRRRARGQSGNSQIRL